MNVISKYFGPLVEWADYSSLAELSYSGKGLRIIVDSPIGNDDFIEVFFPYECAFQVLNQRDYPYWHESSFSKKHVLFEITSGGWVDRVRSNYLSLLLDVSKTREWLLVTSDDCVSIVSDQEPRIEKL